LSAAAQAPNSPSWKNPEMMQTNVVQTLDEA
jgi:hypothetical protein